MSYDRMKQDFFKELNKKLKITVRQKAHTYSISNDLKLKYPGYKYSPGKPDYEVMYKTVSLTHVEIVEDLYQKGVAYPHFIQQLRNFIFDLAKDGDSLDYSKYSIVDDQISSGYTLKSLSECIPWIALQEDINYPTPNFGGRSTCFKRYLEAIEASKPDSTISLDKVKRRTISGRNPDIPNIDYGLLNNLISA